MGRRHPRRPPADAVVGHPDRDRCRVPGRGVEDPELAVELVDDAAGGRIAARPAHVPRGVLGERGGNACGDVVGVEIVVAAAVGGEVDDVPHPHRIAVGAGMIGDADGVVGRQIEDVELLSPPALVALPMTEVAHQRRVHHLGAVGGVVAGPRLGHRQRRRHATGHRHGEELGVTQVPAVSHRPEEHRRAVRGPAVDLVVVAPARRQWTGRRVEGQEPRLAAGGGHDVDLFVAVILAGEGDPFPVGRKLGEQLETGMGRQPCRGAAGRGRQPQIAGISKNHLVAMDVGKPQQLGLGTGRGGNNERKDSEGDEPLESHGNLRIRFERLGRPAEAGPRRRGPGRWNWSSHGPERGDCTA